MNALAKGNVEIPILMYRVERHMRCDESQPNKCEVGGVAQLDEIRKERTGSL